MNRICKQILVSIFVASTTALPARADCGTRRFYNHSPVYFSVNFPDGQGACSVGYNGTPAAACSIPPGGVVQLQFYRATRIGIQSLESDGGKLFPGAEFTMGANCYILHDGNTGNIVVNYPASGDIQTCGPNSGGTFACRY